MESGPRGWRRFRINSPGPGRSQSGRPRRLRPGAKGKRKFAQNRPGTGAPGHPGPPAAPSVPRLRRPGLQLPVPSPHPSALQRPLLTERLAVLPTFHLVEGGCALMGSTCQVQDGVGQFIYSFFSSFVHPSIRPSVHPSIHSYGLQRAKRTLCPERNTWR